MTENWKSEAELQAFNFQWHWNTFPHLRGTLFAIGQNAHNAIKGNLNQATGTIPGPSDLGLKLVRGRVLWIETKLPDGKQSDAQIAWEGLSRLLDHQYVIVNSHESFKSLIFSVQINVTQINIDTINPYEVFIIEKQRRAAAKKKQPFKAPYNSHPLRNLPEN